MLVSSAVSFPILKSLKARSSTCWQSHRLLLLGQEIAMDDDRSWSS